MGWQISYYTVVLLGTASALFGLALFAFRKRSVPGGRELCAILFMVGWWCGCYAIELASAEISAELLLARLEYFAIATIPALWLMFVVSYTGRGAWLAGRRRLALIIVPAVTVFLVWTNDAHGLFYTHVGQSGHFGTLFLDVEHGPGFWFHAFYSYALLVLATWVMLVFLARRPGRYRRQATALVAGTLAPWAANAVFLAGLSPFPHLDLTPIGFAVLGGAVTYAIIGFRLFDLVPIAREKVVESMADGVIVLDHRGRVADLNPAAAAIIGLPAAGLIGRSFADLAAENPLDMACCLELREGRSEAVADRDGSRIYFDRQVTAFPAPGGDSGRLVVLRDITARKLAEQAMARAHEELGIKARMGAESLEAAGQTIFSEILERQKAEKALRESERRLVHFLDGLPLGVFVVDSAGEPLYENRAFQRLAGRSLKRLPDEERGGLSGPVPGARVAGTDLPYPGERDPLVRALGGEGASVTDMELSPPGGPAVPVEVTGAPVFNDLGEVQYALAVYRDISDRKKAELKEKQYYRNLEFLSRTAIGFMGIPPEGDIFRSIAAELAGLAEGSTAVIASYDSGTADLVIRAATGPPGRLKEVGELLGGDLMGQAFRLDAAQTESLVTGRITPVKGGLQGLVAGYLPSKVAARLERFLETGEVYSVGLATSGRLFGAAFLLAGKGSAACDLGVVQTFVNQASVALQRWRAEELVRGSLKEKEILLSEVHHRVKNNLQIVSSLLSLQAQNSRTADGGAVLAEAQNRIRTLALIHERLYASRDMAGVDMADYLGLLVNRLASTYDQPSRRVRVRVEVDKLSLDIDTAIPCGLIVNELVSNSFKHAFPDGREGLVRVRLNRSDNGGYRLSVEDNGVGFPEGLDYARTKTLGCQIVSNLAAQLGGAVGLDREGGTKSTVQFKGTKRRG